MTDAIKADLRLYLQRGRAAIVWKIDGLSEYDIRRPLTPTGTNLLGLVKHLAGVESEYFGAVFDRPFPEPMPWAGHDEEPNVDMWALPTESRDQLVDLYRRTWVHGDATLDSLELTARGRVPWWPEDRRDVSLHRVLVHVLAEVHRHAGHADIIREQMDGATGITPTLSNLQDPDETSRLRHYEQVEAAAQAART